MIRALLVGRVGVIRYIGTYSILEEQVSDCFMRNSLKNKLISAIQKATPYFEYGSEIAEKAIQIPRNPSKLQIAGLGFEALSKSVDLVASVTDDASEWKEIDCGSLTDYFVNFIKNTLDSPIKIPKISFPQNSVYYSYDIFGYELRIVDESMEDEGFSDSSSYILAKNGEEEDVQNAIARLFWEKNGRFVNVETSKGKSSVSKWIPDPLPSESADILYGKIKSHRDKPRSALVHGPPGSGKTCMAYDVAQKLGGYVVKYSANTISKYNGNSIISSSATILKPDVIIINDIDRSPNSSSLLEVFEEIRRPGSVLIATANDVTKLDRAMLRPKRFDILYEVTRLGSDVESRLLSMIPEKFHHRLSQWNAVYIHELGQRAKACRNDDEIEEEIENLEKHIDLEKRAEIQYIESGITS